MAEETNEWSYVSKTDAELEKLAQDLVAGRIFHSVSVERQEDLPMVFMPLTFLEPQHMDAMKKANVASFYEYIDQASPRGFNGMPCFFSFNALDIEDTKKLFIKAKEVNDLLESRLGGQT